MDPLSLRTEVPRLPNLPGRLKMLGVKNDGPSKLQGVKMQAIKTQDLRMLDAKNNGMKQLLTSCDVTGC